MALLFVFASDDPLKGFDCRLLISDVSKVLSVIYVFPVMIH